MIITNAKVQHRPNVVSKLKAVKKHLDKYAQERHAIIHKHSLLDEKLRRIELFYHDGILEEMSEERKARLKTFRANHLREYVIAKKAEFQQMNAQLAELVAMLFASLLAEYQFQKQQFKARGF